MCLEVQEELDSSSGNLTARAGKGPRARRRARAAGDEAADTPPVGRLLRPWVLQHRELLGPPQGPDSGGADRRQRLCSARGRLLPFSLRLFHEAVAVPPIQRALSAFFFFYLVPQYLIYTSVPTHLLAYVLTGLPTDLRTPRGWSLWRPAVGLAHST